MKMSAWTNHEKLRMAVCHFTLELEYSTPFLMGSLQVVCFKTAYIIICIHIYTPSRLYNLNVIKLKQQSCNIDVHYSVLSVSSSYPV